MSEMPLFATMLPVHHVVALALPATVAFDLSIPGQVFGQAADYSFTVCASTAGIVPSTTGFGIDVPSGLDALAGADR